jgi:cytochrome b561
MSLESKAKYSGVAMALHWLVGILVIVSWQITVAAEAAPDREARGEIMGNHFALGVVIFVLVAARFMWRRFNPPPPPLASHANWERALAKITHLAIYTFLLVMPIAGWIAMSSFGSGISVWGLFEVPPLPVPANEALGEQIFEIHSVAGITLLVLIAVHVLAVLKHAVVDRDDTLMRMLP